MNYPYQPLEQEYRSARPLRTLLYLLNRGPGFYWVAMVIFLLKQSCVWIMPFFIARCINTFTDPHRYTIPSLVVFGVVTLLLQLLNIPTHTGFITMISKALRSLELRLRSALVIRLQQLSIAFHDRTESGRLQAKVLRDVEQVQVLCMFFCISGLGGITSIIFAVIVTAIKQPLMLLYFLLMVPLSFGIARLFKGRLKEENQAFRVQLETMSAQVNEMITMIPVARAHGVEQQATNQLEAHFDDVSRRGVVLDRVNALFSCSAWVVFQVALVFSLGVLCWLCWKGIISVGEIALYESLFGMIINSVSNLLNVYPQLSKGIESIRSIGEILECPDLEHNEGEAAVSSVEGRVDFENISFDYGTGRGHALNGLSLSVVPGECIALVGASGSGKSTLINLLIGFRRPQRGRILFDGRDMEQLDMRIFRRHIAVVPQETMLCSGTLRDNILYGDGDRPDEALSAAVEMANLCEFIEQLPDGLDTRIGEGGATLSGGQKQRVAIARALVRDPRILILDEATSALDVVAERQVQQAIDRAVQNRTTFIVAHRLSTIRQADRIVVMKEGRIAEMGTYEELATRPGLFYDMLQLQR